MTTVNQYSTLEDYQIPLPSPQFEAWKYTNLQRFGITPQLAFQNAMEINPEQHQRIEKEISQLVFLNDQDILLVFVNGLFDVIHSRNTEQNQNIKIMSIADYFENASEELKQQYKTKFFEKKSPVKGNQFFIELSNFQLKRSMHIEVSQSTNEKIVILNYQDTTSSTESSINSSTCSIDLLQGVQVSLVEIHSSSQTSNELFSFENKTTKINCQTESSLKHLLCYKGSEQDRQIHNLQVSQAKGAEYQQFLVASEKRLLRQMQHIEMHGEQAKCDLSGVFIGQGKEHLDFNSQIEHLVPNCQSKQILKGILSGHSRGIFDGKIIFHKDAQKSITEQGSYNILLSDDAEIDSKPQLEIDADDVTASHGSTVGQLDAEALFYLQSRGLSEKVASKLLLKSFIMEFLDVLTEDSLKNYISDYIEQQLEKAWLHSSES